MTYDVQALGFAAFAVFSGAFLLIFALLMIVLLSGRRR